MRVLPLVLSLLASPLAAHEFWIEPLAFQVAPDGKVEAHIVNGEEFKGRALPYLPRNFVHFVSFSGGQARPVDGRLGDSPALSLDPAGEGLHVIAYQARNQTLTYEEAEKWDRFVAHKDLGAVAAAHESRGLPETDFVEVYSRYSKSLVAVGAGEGADFRTGLETELVALDNPYVDDVSGGMRVQLFYREDVRANEQVEIYEKAPDGTVAVTVLRTDADGIAVVPVKPGHVYMADAVVLREPAPALASETGAVWETLWANLTWSVPG